LANQILFSDRWRLTFSVLGFDEPRKAGFHKERGLPNKLIGLGKQPDNLQPCDAKQFAQVLSKNEIAKNAQHE